MKQTMLRFKVTQCLILVLLFSFSQSTTEFLKAIKYGTKPGGPEFAELQISKDNQQNPPSKFVHIIKDQHQISFIKFQSVRYAYVGQKQWQRMEKSGLHIDNKAEKEYLPMIRLTKNFGEGFYPTIKHYQSDQSWTPAITDLTYGSFVLFGNTKQPYCQLTLDTHPTTYSYITADRSTAITIETKTNTKTLYYQGKEQFVDDFLRPYSKVQLLADIHNDETVVTFPEPTTLNWLKTPPIESKSSKPQQITKKKTKSVSMHLDMDWILAQQLASEFDHTDILLPDIEHEMDYTDVKESTLTKELREMQTKIENARKEFVSSESKQRFQYHMDELHEQHFFGFESIAVAQFLTYMERLPKTVLKKQEIIKKKAMNCLRELQTDMEKRVDEVTEKMSKIREIRQSRIRDIEAHIWHNLDQFEKKESQFVLNIHELHMQLKADRDKYDEVFQQAMNAKCDVEMTMKDRQKFYISLWDKLHKGQYPAKKWNPNKNVRLEKGEYIDLGKEDLNFKNPFRMKMQQKVARKQYSNLYEETNYDDYVIGSEENSDSQSAVPKYKYNYYVNGNDRYESHEKYYEFWEIMILVFIMCITLICMICIGLICIAGVFIVCKYNHTKSSNALEDIYVSDV